MPDISPQSLAFIKDLMASAKNVRANMRDNLYDIDILSSVLRQSSTNTTSSRSAADVTSEKSEPDEVTSFLDSLAAKTGTDFNKSAWLANRLPPHGLKRLAELTAETGPNAANKGNVTVPATEINPATVQPAPVTAATWEPSTDVTVPRLEEKSVPASVTEGYIPPCVDYEEKRPRITYPQGSLASI